MLRSVAGTVVAIAIAVATVTPAHAQYGAYRDEARRLQTQLDFATERDRQAASDWNRKPAYEPLRTASSTPRWTYDQRPTASSGAPSDGAARPREPSRSDTVVISRKETTPAEAAQRIEREAAAGSIDAQMWIAHMYYDGWGVTANAATAAGWFQKAAEAGNADARFSLATLHRYGEGVTKDLAAALRWYRKAAEQGDVRAQFAAGNAYFNGDGTARDIGTQFEVSSRGEELRLRVRDGRVRLSHGEVQTDGRTGEEIVIAGDGPWQKRGFPPRDPYWGWVEVVAPAPDIDGEPVRTLLDWVVRETGRPLRFASPDVERLASTTRLHGTIRHLPPMDALAATLATTDLGFEVLADGTILIDSRIADAAGP